MPTERIWFGSRANIKKLSQIDTKLHLGSTVVEPVTSVRKLGVYIDGELNMLVHIGKISSVCFYHLRRLRQLRNVMSSATMQRLVSTFVLSRLDYCNLVLAGLPAVTLTPLQRTMNAAVRLFAGLGWRDHITSAMRDLRWLPIIYRIRYKLCIRMRAAANNNSPKYITEIPVHNSSLQERAALRSFTSGGYVVPRSKTEFGKRAFCVAVPKAWNELPPEFRHMSDIQIFKRALKTHLFNAACDNLVYN